MDAFQQAHQALCLYGELKRTRTAGGEKTQAFLAQITAAMAQLSTNDQLILQSIYVLDMTQEETAEAVERDPSTIARRKRRAVERLALYLYPDSYLQEKGF